MRYLLIIFIVLSCATNNIPTQKKSLKEEFRESLVGKHYSLVIKRTGAYTRKIDDGLGGTIYIWKLSYTEEVQIFCNKDGIIYDVYLKK